MSVEGFEQDVTARKQSPDPRDEQIKVLRDALKDIAHASPGLGYDYEDLQDLAEDALAHQPERKEEGDE